MNMCWKYTTFSDTVKPEYEPELPDHLINYIKVALILSIF